MEVEDDELEAALEHGGAAAGRSREARWRSPARRSRRRGAGIAEETRRRIGIGVAGKEQLRCCGAGDGRGRRQR